MDKTEKIFRIILISSLFLLSSFFLLHTICDPDVFFHLGIGKYIFENLKVPKQDIFSYTMYGSEYIEFHWLFQFLLYITYKLFDFTGLIIFKTITILTTLSIFFNVSYKKENYLPSVLVFFLTILILQERTDLRPETTSLFFSAMYIYIINKKEKLFWLIPFLQVLWVNVHGNLSPIGLAIIFFYALTNRKLYKIFVASVFAGFINPWGYKYFYFVPLTVSHIFSKTDILGKVIGEFQKPFGVSQVKPSLVFYYSFLFLTLILVITHIKKLTASELLIYASFAILSSSAIRNIVLFSFIVSPIIVKVLNEFKFTKPLRYGFGLLIIIFSGYFSYATISNKTYYHYEIPKKFGFGVSEMFSQEKACRFILEKNIKGNIFHDMVTGNSILLWLYPKNRTCIDCCPDARPYVYKNFYLTYEKVFIDNQFFKEFLNHYAINCIFLNYTLPLASSLFYKVIKFNDWKLVYYDNSSAVLLRTVPENKKIIARGITDNTSDENDYLTCIFKGQLFSELKKTEKAISSYKKAILLNPESAVANNNLGNIYLDKGNYKDALNCLLSAKKILKKSAEIYNNIGRIYLKTGQYEEAKDSFENGIKFNPNIPQLHYNYGKVCEKKGLIEKAIQEYQIALQLDPEYESPKKALEELNAKK